jgi:phosphoglucomutase
MDCVKAVDIDTAKTMTRQAAIEKGLYQVIGKDIDDPYIAELKKLVIHQDAINQVGRDITIVYTPLHGTGNIPVRRVLKELGFTNVYVVPQQEKPDGDFPTVAYPNPEAKEAFALALALGKEKNADLILATDPDADRLGVYVKDKQGEYHCLTGNMSGCLIGNYVIGQRKERDGGLPADGAFIKSIVTTNLADAIARDYGIELIEVLTGFKYIGGKILEFEKTGHGTYLFGMEESYGCLTGTYARDKDAVDASMTLCEACAYYKTKGMTLWDAMLDLYQRLGYYQDAVSSITLAGKEGIEKISSIMTYLRANPLTEIGGHKVTAVRDYDKDTITDIASGTVRPTGLPKSNVLYYELTDDAWICVRPSGTEPKIKFYYGIKGSDFDDADKKSQKMKKALDDLAEKLTK